jgi:hypothetical protein
MPIQPLFVWDGRPWCVLIAITVRHSSLMALNSGWPSDLVRPCSQASGIGKGRSRRSGTIGSESQSLPPRNSVTLPRQAVQRSTLTSDAFGSYSHASMTRYQDHFNRLHKPGIRNGSSTIQLHFSWEPYGVYNFRHHRHSGRLHEARGATMGRCCDLTCPASAFLFRSASA